MTKKDSIIFAGYRSWAEDLYRKSKDLFPQFNWYLAKSSEELVDLYDIKSCNLVILAGWSWILSRDQVNKKTVLGLHPSDLPNYAGGSPVQNQILEGITKTKMSLFKLDEKIDHGDIVYKTDLDLSGGISNIFKNMTESGIEIVKKIVKDYPDFPYTSQKGVGKMCRRLKPSSSRLQKNMIKDMTALEIYNFIRCREDPYPNVYIEDDSGRVIFKEVKYCNKENSK